MLLVLMVAFFGGLASILWYVSYSSAKVTRQAVLNDSANLSEVIKAFRTLYTSEVVESVRSQGMGITHDYKNRGDAIPLPATLTLLLCDQISENSSGHEVRLYSEYPFPWRLDGGIHDDFERDAIQHLATTPDQPYYRFEETEDGSFLRYATADVMRASCVSCHNNHPDSPKTDWQVGDLRGVVSIKRPLEGIVASSRHQLNNLFIGLTIFSLTAFLILSFLVLKIRNVIDERLSDQGIREVAKEMVQDLEASAGGSLWKAIGIGALLSGLIFFIDLTLPLGIAAGVPYVLVVLLSLWAHRQSVTFSAGVLTTLLTIAGFAFSPVGGEPWKVLANRLLAIFAIWTTAILCLWQQRMTAQRVRIEAQKKSAELYNQELYEANEVAQSATRSKSEFLANMSHELRTPMTAILGYADILSEQGSSRQASQEELQAIETIRRNGKHLLTIVNDILDISKIEAGKMSVDQIAFSPWQIVSDVASLMRPKAINDNLQFSVESIGPIPATIQSDPVRLRQILLNLAGNALKFTETGGVRVIVKLADAIDGSNPRLRFEIIDTGIGMTHEQIANLFQSFSQADTTMTRRFGGTGLGLMISRRLTQMLGGDIVVASTPGEGSSFAVTIETGSLQGVEMLHQVDEADMAHRELNGQPTTAMRLNGRILLAEDGPDNQRLISFILRKAGAEVTVAENGRIAYEMAIAAAQTDEPFDVILMDMQMPELDGYGATRLLRSEGFNRPIIALTAHALAGEREKCLKAGCDDFANKPIDKSKLFGMISRYLEASDKSAA